MTASNTKSTSSSNGSAMGAPVAKVREAGDTVASAARKANGPALAAGATAAGLAGGLALGARLASKRRGLSALVSPRPRVLGIPIGRKPGLTKAVEALGQAARELNSATSKAVATTDDVRQIRDQLDRVNRQSPVEVVLDALTHRRGAHKRES
jgi:hypothetical protein